MLEYNVKRLAGFEDFMARRDSLERAWITNYPWGCAFRPETYACVAWDGENIYLYMKSSEATPCDAVDCDNGDIYMDSCMEFFINPIWRQDAEYFINFEMNPRRHLFLAHGHLTDETRTLLDTTAFNSFSRQILPQGSHSDGWDTFLAIPIEFFRNLHPGFELKSGDELRCNFYKCGDGTPVPHFGCWNDIDPKTEQPNFYRPDCFGRLIFE